MQKFTRFLFVMTVLVCGFQHLHAQADPPEDSAPSPGHTSDQVVSIFSDAFTVNPGISTVELGEVLSIAEGDEAIKITEGINSWTYIHLDESVDVNDKGFIHFDVYVLSGFNGKIRFNQSSGYIIPFAFTEGWNSVDVPLQDVRDLSLPIDFADLKTIGFINSNGSKRTIFVDNIYAYGEGDETTDPEEPESIEAAPAPEHQEDDVISFFSDAYANAVGIESVDMGEVLQLSETDKAIKITGGLGGWTYIHFDQNIDIEEKEFIHFDVFVKEDVFTGKVRLDGSSGYQIQYEFVPGWNSVDIALQDIKDLPLAVDLSQLGSIGLINAAGYDRTVYIDNIYAYGVNTEPVDPEYPVDPDAPEAAPAPEHSEEEVISIFSDTYTNTAGIESVDEGEVLAISDNDLAIKITDGLDGWSYIYFDQKVDISEKGIFHLDVYVPESQFTGKIRFDTSSGYQIPTELEQGWNSIDIVLEDLSDLATPANFSELGSVAFINASGYARTIYVDNIYAYDGNVEPEEPEIPLDPNAPESADLPEHPEEDVTSFFSDVYEDVTTISVNNAGVPELTFEYVANATDDKMISLKGLNWGMFRLDNYPWSISEDKDFLHLDVYLPSSSASLRVGIGAWTQVNSGLYTLEQGWNAVDVPLDIFREGGADMDGLIIIRLTSGSGFAISQLYVDNIYAYEGVPKGGLPPSFEIPVANEPIMAPATVKSLFTAKYDDIVALDNLTASETTEFTIHRLTQEDNVLKFRNLDEASVGAATSINIDDMDSIHFNVYLDSEGDAGSLEIGLESGEMKVYSTVVPELIENGWAYVNISVNEFRDAGINISAIDNILYKGSGNLYIDNIFAFAGDYALGKGEEGPIAVDWETASQDDVLPDRDMAFLGVNLSTGSGGTVPGVYGTAYSYPTFEDLHYFKSKGVRLIRLPFKWERVQHEVGGPLDLELDVKKLNEVIAEAERIGMYVMPDMHNYCRRYVNGVKYKFGESAELTDEHFADVWTKLAQEWKEFDNIWGYDIMNEPYGLESGIWASAAQAAIDGIRSVDTETPIVIEGQNYAASSTWLQTGAPLFEELTDPDDNLIWQAHTYFDANKSGQYEGDFDTEVSSSSMHIARLKPFVDWLKENGQKGIMGEFGVPRDDVRWLNMLDEVLAYLKENQVSATYWCAGSWYEQNSLSVQPLKNYTIERTPMRILGQYFPDYHVEGPSTDVPKIKTNSGVNVYPNPFRNHIVVESGTEVESVRIFNLAGQMVKSVYHNVEKRTEINLTELPKGIYLLNIQFEDGNVTSKKVIKQ